MKRQRAFTLIELLVVIAIIALLVSILMPSLQKAKELAKDVVCRSNQKNISYGIHLYAQENDDAFPYGARVGRSGGLSWVPLDWTQRVGKIPANQLPRFSNGFESGEVPRPSADPNHIVHVIRRNGYVDYPSFGSNDEVPYEGPFVCPAFVDQVNPKSTWEWGTSYHYSINGGLSGFFRNAYSGREQVTVTLISDVKAGAVLIGDCNLNPGGNIRVSGDFRTNSRGELYYQNRQWPLDFGPWTHQRHVGKWGQTLPCNFYGHPGERADLSYADGHVETVAEIDRKEWRIR